jgi:hypothetical protein
MFSPFFISINRRNQNNENRDGLEMMYRDEKEMLILERRLRLLKSDHSQYFQEYEYVNRWRYGDVENISKLISQLQKLELECQNGEFKRDASASNKKVIN